MPPDWLDINLRNEVTGEHPLCSDGFGGFIDWFNSKPYLAAGGKLFRDDLLLTLIGLGVLIRDAYNSLHEDDYDLKDVTLTEDELQIVLDSLEDFCGCVIEEIQDILARSGRFVIAFEPFLDSLRTSKTQFADLLDQRLMIEVSTFVVRQCNILIGNKLSRKSITETMETFPKPQNGCPLITDTSWLDRLPFVI